VTGTGLKPYAVDVDVASTEVEGTVDSLLEALGL
jgi:hypothetical protein